MEPINKAINLECNGTFHSVRVWKQHSGVLKIMVASCKCNKKYGGEENCSSNIGEKITDGKNVRDEDQDNDD